MLGRPQRCLGKQDSARSLQATRCCANTSELDGADILPIPSRLLRVPHNRATSPPTNNQQMTLRSRRRQAAVTSSCPSWTDDINSDWQNRNHQRQNLPGCTLPGKSSATNQLPHCPRPTTTNKQNQHRCQKSQDWKLVMRQHNRSVTVEGTTIRAAATLAMP